MPTSLEERSVAAVVEAKNKKNSLGANRSIFIINVPLKWLFYNMTYTGLSRRRLIWHQKVYPR